MDANGPVAGAIVQVQGTPNQTTTAADGSYRLHGQGLGGTDAVTVTAWSGGHYIGLTSLDPSKPFWERRGRGRRRQAAARYSKATTTNTPGSPRRA